MAGLLAGRPSFASICQVGKEQQGSPGFQLLRLKSSSWSAQGGVLYSALRIETLLCPPLDFLKPGGSLTAPRLVPSDASSRICMGAGICRCSGLYLHSLVGPPRGLQGAFSVEPKATPTPSPVPKNHHSWPGRLRPGIQCSDPLHCPPLPGLVVSCFQKQQHLKPGWLP